MNQQNLSDAPLEYRLRSSVQYKTLPDGQPVLILSYPLKAVYINRFWEPVLNQFKSSEYFSIDEIAKDIPQFSFQQIELFLDDLVRKCFFEVRGFPQLKDDDLPSVSIIIPVHNRPDDIRACMESLEDLEYPKEKTEIIVVDDASQDNTPEVIKKFTNVKLIELTVNSQASFCRNRAAEVATGEILAFIDSDCLADPSWLKQLVPAFRDSSLGALGGFVDSYYNEKKLDQYEKVKSALQISSLFKRSNKEEQFFYVPTCNFLVRRKLFLELGGLKEELHVGEDVDFSWRLQNSKAKLEYRPVGRVFHKHRNNLWPFCSRRFDYGTSEPLLQKIHPDRKKKLFLPPHESLFWLLLASALFFRNAIPLILSFGIFLSDAVQRYQSLSRRKLPIGFFAICYAVIRSYLSLSYHCCNFISRYYLIPAVLLLPFFPKAAAVILAMHLITSVAEYVIKQARMNPFTFIFFFTLEQMSYQAGVWWGCIKHLNPHPLLPKIVHNRLNI